MKKEIQRFWISFTNSFTRFLKANMITLLIAVVLAVAGAIINCNIAGILLIFFFLILLYDWFTYNRIELDRTFAESTWRNALRIFVFIISVPITIFVAIIVGGIQPEELWWENQARHDLPWTIFYFFLDPGNQHMATTSTGQIVAMILALLGSVLMSGLLVSYLTNLFDRRAEDFSEGRCRYKYSYAFGKYSVIIGGHEMAVNLCQSLLKNPELNLNYIFIHTSSNIQSLRSKLRSTLGKDERKVVIYYGERNIEAELDSLYCDRAENIYILGEENEQLHDAKNMKCVTYLTNKVKTTLPCYVLFEYQTTFAAFQASSKKASDLENGEHLIFIPFNFHETWAQKVLTGEYEPENKDKYIPLDGAGIKYEDNDTVHVIIVGMSRMGIAMGVETAHVAHYPNFIRDNQLRTRITFIDSNMQEEREFFMSRYKSLFDVSRWRTLDKENMNSEWVNKHSSLMDVEWEFIDGGIQSPHVSKYLDEAAIQPNRRITVMVCLPVTNQSMASTLYLPDSIYTSKQVQQVLIYQKHEDALAQHLSSSAKYAKIKPFGMTNASYDDALIVESMPPRAIGKVYSIVYDWKENKLTCDADELYKLLKDGLIERWEEKLTIDSKWNICKIWRQWSNIYNTCSIPTKNRCIVISSGEKGQLWKAVRLERVDAYTNKEKLTCDADELYNQLIKELIEQEEKLKIDSKWNICKIWRQWSNVYNACSIPTKKRCIVISLDEEGQLWKAVRLERVDAYTNKEKLTCDADELYKLLKDGLIKRENGEFKIDSEWNTSKIWGQWSNIYNACSIPTKNRCIVISSDEYKQLWNAVRFDDGSFCIDKEKLNNQDLLNRFHQLAELEHNRWNMEKLLMGYRTLTSKEKEDLKKGRKTKDELKGDLIKAHADICPFSELKDLDPGVEDYDYMLTLVLPDINEIDNILKEVNTEKKKTEENTEKK